MFSSCVIAMHTLFLERSWLAFDCSTPGKKKYFVASVPLDLDQLLLCVAM